MLNQKIRSRTNKQASVDNSKEKKRSTEKDLMADIIEKDFKTTLKDAKRTKGGCGKSQENSV